MGIKSINSIMKKCKDAGFSMEKINEALDALEVNT